MTTWLLYGALAAACGDDDDTRDGGDDGPSQRDAATTRDAGGGDGAAAGGGGSVCIPPNRPRPPASCAPAADDYAPCKDDGYEACISDDGDYHPIDPSISTVGRVQAFEEVADLLFDPTADAASADFLMALAIYQEDEGLDSRVVRRYDPHYTVPDGTDCTLEDVPEEFPDYCVGPAQLQPILLGAMNLGAMGQAVREQAARIEAALLWFLYISPYKESLTCTDVARDCDSSYAYYTGGEEARGGIGLARYVAEVDPYAHERAWDGLLAVRCWRDLDDGELAVEDELRDRAREQYDRALLDGLAAIVRDRLQKMQDSDGDEQRYYFAFVTTLGPALLREAEERSADDAAVLGEELAKDDPAEIDAEAAVAAIEAMFECP